MSLCDLIVNGSIIGHSNGK